MSIANYVTRLFGDASSWVLPDQETHTVDERPAPKPIDDLDLTKPEFLPTLKFVFAFGVGFFFFLVPVPSDGSWTVPFDIVVSFFTDNFPVLVGWFALALIVAGGVLTTVSEFRVRGYHSFDPDWLDLEYWETSLGFWLLRVVGLVLAPIMFFQIGPEWLVGPSVRGVIWAALILAVAVIVPIGAVFINLFVELGGLEFVGSLARPVMRRLFRVPGRAALDGIASWVGSYSVGLYVTRNVFERGEYNKRDVYIIATCFGTVSIGFVGVVAATVGLLRLFPIIFLSYLVCMVACGIILVRVPPLSKVPPTYIESPQVEQPITGSIGDYWRYAVSQAVTKAKEGDSIIKSGAVGFVDGLKLIGMIIGTILAVGTAALVIAEHTPVFDMIAQPLVPVFSVLGFAEAETVAVASIIGITEMFIPALLIAEGSAMARFFIATLSISQLIFFSSVGPMMMDMFSDVPIRFRDLVVLFILRTIICIAVLVPITYGLASAGIL
jgi:nucleoside recognition membrane protein YjiH